MNNDATPSTAAGQPSTGNDGADTTREHESSPDSPALVERNRKAGQVKKLQFTTHLMKSLDMVVFAEICALYYMEIGRAHV